MHSVITQDSNPASLLRNHNLFHLYLQYKKPICLVPCLELFDVKLISLILGLNMLIRNEVWSHVCHVIDVILFGARRKKEVNQSILFCDNLPGPRMTRWNFYCTMFCNSSGFTGNMITVRQMFVVDCHCGRWKNMTFRAILIYKTLPNSDYFFNYYTATACLPRNLILWLVYKESC